MAGYEVGRVPSLVNILMVELFYCQSQRKVSGINVFQSLIITRKDMLYKLGYIS